MCGRFTREFTWREVHAFLTLPMEFLEQVSDAFRPSYNVAPTQASPVCRVDKDGQRAIASMEWGLRPAWVDKPGLAPINARSETVATSPMFRQAFKRRRCLVPVSGFYEWKKAGGVDTRTGEVTPAGSGIGSKGSRAGAKQPFYIRLTDAPIMCFAGLWEFRMDAATEGARGDGAEGSEGDAAADATADAASDRSLGSDGGDSGSNRAAIEKPEAEGLGRTDGQHSRERPVVPRLSFTILTTRPNTLMREIHDRMPVILDPSRFDEWLRAETPDPALFEPFPAERMEAFEVSTRVNSPKNNDPSLVKPHADPGLFG